LTITTVTVTLHCVHKKTKWLKLKMARMSLSLVTLARDVKFVLTDH